MYAFPMEKKVFHSEICMSILRKLAKDWMDWFLVRFRGHADTFLPYRNIDNDKQLWCAKMTSGVIVLFLACRYVWSLEYFGAL